MQQVSCDTYSFADQVIQVISNNFSWYSRWVVIHTPLWIKLFEIFLMQPIGLFPIFWWWILLGNALLLNSDVESMTNVHLSHRKCISAKLSTLFQHLCISFWNLHWPGTGQSAGHAGMLHGFLPWGCYLWSTILEVFNLAYGQLTRMQHGSSSILEFVLHQNFKLQILTNVAESTSK